MTRIARIDVLTARLPFRFSFGHALAERRESTNVYVRLTLDDGSVGYGEGVPREYVTGETVESALAALCEQQAPALLGRSIDEPEDVPAAIDAAAPGSTGPELTNAARCALELALLDACGKRFGRSVADWLAPDPAATVRYDAVIPFSSPKKLVAIALAVRALGIRQVKIKVGDDLERELGSLRLLRRLLGSGADLRVDANCAWATADEALAAIAAMRRYGISAVEQPLPPGDLEALARVTAETRETIIVDESLRTPGDAAALVEARACDAFNIRVSKCAGLLTSMQIAQIGIEAGIDLVVGAQVGESGILSAAGRHFAASIVPRYVEGSGGSLLLKEDLTVERVLPGFRGRARRFTGPGLGVHVDEAVLERHRVESRSFVAEKERAA
jgi:L-alanine-DL-glutamate epimerase-like enolase superfamily enzyme